MSPELDAILCDKYPKIFAQRELPMNETVMCWGFSCDDGWFTLIDVLCELLQNETDTNGAPQLQAVQVKEKYGGLRFYTTRSTDVQHAFIDMASVLSMRTCEVCGAPGKLSVQGGWDATRCPAHTKPNSTANNSQ